MDSQQFSSVRKENLLVDILKELPKAVCHHSIMCFPVYGAEHIKDHCCPLLNVGYCVLVPEFFYIIMLSSQSPQLEDKGGP